MSSPAQRERICLSREIDGNRIEVWIYDENEFSNGFRLLYRLSERARIEQMKYEPHICKSEEEARELVKSMPEKGKWPCYFSASNTTGEKDFEEFYSDRETLDLNRFKSIGIIKSNLPFNSDKLDVFTEKISQMRESKSYRKEDIVTLFKDLLPEFVHDEKDRYLDQKM